MVFLEAEAPRVACREHGVTAAAVPWARHGAGHTHAFDQQTAWMAAECSKTATALLMRTSWRTVGNIVERFVADRDRHTDRLNGLRRIGIDEISHRKGQKYMTVVVCHDSGKVVWMADGHGKSVLHAFFDALGAERAGRLTHISADGALWIAEVLAERAPASLRRRLGRDPSTVSRELRSNAATRGGRLDYRASVAQWKADLVARRPKTAKLAANDRLRDYVQERLSGQVSRSDGTVLGPEGPRWKGRNKPHRGDRQWVMAWSPEQIANRLKVDFPDDESMRISHEAI